MMMMNDDDYVTRKQQSSGYHDFSHIAIILCLTFSIIFTVGPFVSFRFKNYEHP